MSYLVIAAAVVVLFTFMARSIARKRQRERASETARASVIGAYALDDVFVSDVDGSFVGLSSDGERVVVGRGEDSRAFPTTAIRAVEGVRDGVVLIRAEPDGDPVAPVPVAEQGVADAPDRIASLGLRLTVEDQVFDIVFHDTGRHGVSADNAPFRKQAALTEAWFRKLSTAMRRAG